MRGLGAAVVASTLLSAMAALACKCATDTPFLDAALSQPVAIVRVKTPGRLSVQVTVERVLSAGTPLPATLTVLGGDGRSCDASVATFTRGARVVMALSGSPSAFRLGGCGVYWLPLDGDEVTGRIAPGVDRLGLEVFEQRLRAAQASYRRFTSQ